MDKPHLTVETSTTQGVEPGERADYWAELITSYHRRMAYDFPGGSDFNGRTKLCRTSKYQLVGWKSDGVSYVRTPNHVRDDSDDDFRLLLTFAGRTELWDDGGGAHLPHRAGRLVTLDRPIGLRHGHGTSGVLMTIPRHELEHRVDTEDSLFARPMDLTSGLGRVVTDMLTGLLEESDALDGYQFDAAASHIVDLLCMHARARKMTSIDHLDKLDAAIRHHVRAHATDPGLSTATIARSLGWSTRQIQLALRHSGTTPRELIREERLQLAYRRLSDPSFRHQSIAAIAGGLGFGSASAFSTIFRRRFGVSPRDIRHSVRPATAAGR
ncbi:AraC family transcriptional regulator [Nocardia sp. CDC186]|uniref:AraC family transcriptional regulator n=1 Tax=Nocardia implantans TaxID=3108168 RepID=A0ABU6B483_9NOCA|nr:MULTISPECIES: AraC family transcriptional regulator [unclassified Nocardia]MBF6196273.1 AraC family transcriptional regulator [Nocardia beijingensis]MEA3527763.1 AraC family transcriptional regulator [Nocardia sp. CDC192]MEB3514531.1 AraC family transcriptional regulator [Nocardia sp. CDC186]